MLLQEIKNIFRSELDPLYERTEVDSFFGLFIERYLNLPSLVLALQPDLILTKAQEQPFFEGLTRLRQEEPIQYIFGEAHFMGFDLEVNQHVLIPRPETEGLIRWALATEALRATRDMDAGLSNPTETGVKGNLDTQDESIFRILDIGTGSGCIAIVLGKTFPKAEVYALDISEKALEVAGNNAKKYDTDIKFIHADILHLDKMEVKFDMIISNPPYVWETEKKVMRNNVKKYEPETALYVPDEDPLKFYKPIIDFATKHLADNGLLFFETNPLSIIGVKKCLLKSGFVDVELKNDIYGKSRMLCACWNSPEA